MKLSRAQRVITMFTIQPMSSPEVCALSGVEMQSRLTQEGQLTLSLRRVDVGEVQENEIVVRIEAAPINPSDVAGMLEGASTQTLRAAGTPERPVVVGQIPGERLTRLKSRMDAAVVLGNEGAGTVVQAGAAVRHLLGRIVSIIGAGAFAEYRRLSADLCMVWPEGATAIDGASGFINPLTALSMIETMRREGHRALIHTAAASSLGQMLNRICLSDGIALINIVRTQEQKAMLESMGAKHVVNSSSAEFEHQLVDAIAATDATLAFDAIGGGEQVNTILRAMESASLNTSKPYSRYGSGTHKQVYVYGNLDRTVTQIDRSYGMDWGVGGFLLTTFLARIEPEAVSRMKDRVRAEVRTTFASHYSHAISLVEALDLAHLQNYARPATGVKYLINPSIGTDL